MESYVHHVKMATSSKKEFARHVGLTASLANQVQLAISAYRDISGMERYVRIVESLTANRAKRPSFAASVRKGFT